MIDPPPIYESNETFGMKAWFQKVYRAVSSVVEASLPIGAQNVTFSQPDIGASSRTVQNKLIDDDVSAADFGAVLDGVTDDAAALTSALATGRRVKWRGTLKVGSQIVVPTGASLIGEGCTSDNGTRGNTCILRGFTGSSATVLVSGDDCLVEGVDIDNDNQGTGDCLVASGTRPCVRSVSVRKSGGVGFRIGSTGINTNLWRAEHVIALNNASHGMYVHDTDDAVPDVNAGLLFGLDARSNGGDGLRVDNAFDNQFFGVCAQANTGYGIRCVGTATRKCQGQTFWFPYTESNTAGEVLFSTDTDYCFVFGYRTGSLSADGITDNGTNNFVLGHNATNVSGHFVKNALKFKKVRLDDTSISGYWDVYKDTDRKLIFELMGTTADPVSILFKHNDATKRVRLTSQGANCGTQAALTYGATVNTDASDLNWGYLAVTDANALTIANPTNGQEGQLLTYEIRNLSGGAMGAITWGADFKLAGAFTNPANNARRTITFGHSNALWIEQARAAADIT